MRSLILCVVVFLINGVYSLGWAQTIIVVASGGDVGRYSSLNVVDGNPAISYHDWTNNTIRFVRAANPNGTSWGTSVTVTQTQSSLRGQTPTCLVVNGNPAISYINYDHGTFKYVRATNSNGSSWNIPVDLGRAGGGESDISFALVDGHPAISYPNWLSSSLGYVRATDPNGSSLGGTSRGHLAGERSLGYTSLNVVNGRPAISYSEFAGYYGYPLKYVRATDVTGTSWGAPVTVDSSGEVYATSLSVINGNPAISYYLYDPPNHTLKFVRANDPNGQSWGIPVTLDSTPAESITLITGEMAIPQSATPTAISNMCGQKIRTVNLGDHLSLSIQVVSTRDTLSKSSMASRLSATMIPATSSTLLVISRRLILIVAMTPALVIWTQLAVTPFPMGCGERTPDSALTFGRAARSFGNVQPVQLPGRAVVDRKIAPSALGAQPTHRTVTGATAHRYRLVTTESNSKGILGDRRSMSVDAKAHPPPRMAAATTRL